MTPEALTTRRRPGRDCILIHAAADARSAARSPRPPDGGGSPLPPRIRSRSAAIAARAACTAIACDTPSSDAASSSTDGSARSSSATSGERAFDPATRATLELLLPDRPLALDPADRLARARERLAAVRRRYGDDDARLRQRHQPDAVLGSDSDQPVPFLHRSQDRRNLLLGHLGVRLVLECLDLARDPF